MVEMEFRQHSVVHARALKDIHENGIHGDLQPMTREVIDTFRAIGSIQKRYGKKMAHRYIISFTKSAQHVADVFELAHLSFAHEEDVPELDVIPLFEQLEDLEGCVDVLDQMLTLPVVQKRLAQTNRRMEVMLGQATRPSPHCASISYGNTMVITFAGTGTSSETERRFFTHLVRDGLPVKVESNRTR